MGEFFVYSSFFGALLFFFPVFLGLDIYADLPENRAYFALSVFGVRVLGGYGEVLREGIAIHLTKKFAWFIAYRNMGNTRRYFEITAGFQLYRFHQVLEAGGAGTVGGLMLAALLRSAGGAAFSVLKTRHPFLSLENGTVLADRPCLKLAVETVTVFNGLIITLALAKKTLEVFLNWIRNKRLTASWNARRSSS